MEIKKSLLQAMLIGLTVGSISSCGMFDQMDEDTQVSEGAHDGETENADKCWDNCMACGLG